MVVGQRRSKVSGEPSWVIQTEDLQIGSSLSFDLTDASGQILHKAGTPITERLKERLQNRNINSVTVRGAGSSEEADIADSILLECYSGESIKLIQDSIQNAQQSIIRLVKSLEERSSDHDLAEVRRNVDQFVSSASENMAATLAVLGLQLPISKLGIAERIATRSIKTALLGVAMSVVRKDTESESVAIGMAGLLHDCSLLRHPEWFDPKPNFRDLLVLDEYRRHPIESAEMLLGIPGISTQVTTMITQVHEQADGSGYPRGMKLGQTMLGATILNISDAYFALTEPFHRPAIVPADALAYLCYHAAQGKFCKKTLQRMVQCMSIYPVGSLVVLDDQSKAVVIEGNQDEPLKPKVRIINEIKPSIDLRHSRRHIIGPHITHGSKTAERIKKSQMQEILWRADR
ncbi:MAG: HD domain-containing phosphohydrolase [Pirellula sp.]